MLQNYTEKITIREIFPKIAMLIGCLSGCSVVVYLIIDRFNTKNWMQLEVVLFIILFGIIILSVGLSRNKTNKIKQIIINDSQICIKYINDNKKNQLVLGRDSVLSTALNVYITTVMQGGNNVLYKTDLFINTKENITYKISHNSVFTEGLKKIFKISKYLPDFSYNIDAHGIVEKYHHHLIDEIYNLVITGKKISKL